MTANVVLTKIKRELLQALWKVMPVCVNVTMHGQTFKLPLRRDLDHKAMRPNRETWMDAVIQQVYAHTHGAFIDIGAHAGQSLLKIKSLVPEATYVGFEPNANCAAYVHEIMRLNHFENCSLFPIGLGERDEIRTLFSHNSSDFTGTVIEGFRGKDDTLLTQQVVIAKAQNVLAQLSLAPIAIVKIDVEGFEASVLSGLRGILADTRPVVICEILRTHDVSHPSHAFRVQSRQICGTLLQDLNYAIWGVHHDQTIAPCGQINDAWTNYVFVPQEQEMVWQAHTAHVT